MKNGETRVMLPWSRSCFVCGEENPRGMHARSYVNGDRIELPFIAPFEFAGWRTVVHGGLVATVLDEVMTWAAIVGSRKPCFSAEFSVRLLRPLSPGTACTAVGRLKESRKRLFLTEAFLEDEAGRCYARAEGRYMTVPPERLAEARDDFILCPECHDIRDVLGME